MRYLIILLLLFTSCASRKVAISKEETKTTIDSTAIVKTDSISTTNNNIKIVETSEEFEIKPLDTTKAFIYNGKTYFNAILKHKKSNKVLVDTSKKIVSKNVLKQVYKKTNKNTFKKEKNTDKRSFSFIYIILLIIIFYLIYKFKNNFKLKFL